MISPGEPVALFTLVSNLVENLGRIASEGIEADIHSSKRSIVDTLKKACEGADNARLKFEKLTKTQKLMKEAVTKAIDRLTDEHYEKVVT